VTIVSENTGVHVCSDTPESTVRQVSLIMTAEVILQRHRWHWHIRSCI